MCILIFFMASTAFLGPEWFVTASLPREGASPPSAAASAFELPAPRFTLTLRSEPSPVETTRTTTLVDGLGRTGVTLDELSALLAERSRDAGHAGIELVLQPQPSVPYEDVVRARDLAEQAGITKVGIAPSAPPAVPEPL